jgi:hypothetical protein
MHNFTMVDTSVICAVWIQLVRGLMPDSLLGLEIGDCEAMKKEEVIIVRRRMGRPLCAPELAIPSLLSD